MSALPGWSSRLEFQRLVPHFHKGELVHRRFPPGSHGLGVLGPALAVALWVSWQAADLSPASYPGGGLGWAAMGICTGWPPPRLSIQGTKGNEEQGLTWKEHSFEVRKKGAYLSAIMHWPHDLGLVTSLGPQFPYL